MAHPTRRNPHGGRSVLALGAGLLGSLAFLALCLADPAAAQPSLASYQLVDTWHSVSRGVVPAALEWPAGHLPGGLGVAAGGDLFVTDLTAHTVRRYPAAGGPVEVFGGPGSGPGQFDRPRDVAPLDDGRLAVSDSGNQRVQVLAADGSPRTAWPVADPQGIVGRGNEVVVVSRSDKTLLRYNPDTRSRLAVTVLNGSVAPEGLTFFTYTLAGAQRQGYMITDPRAGQVWTLSGDGSGLRAFFGLDSVRALAYAGLVGSDVQPTLHLYAGVPGEGVVPIAWGPDIRGPLGPGSNLPYADVSDLVVTPAGRLLAAVQPDGVVDLGDAAQLFDQLADDFGRLVAPRRIAVGDDALVADERARLALWSTAGVARRSVPAAAIFLDGSPQDVAAAGPYQYALDQDGSIVRLHDGTYITGWQPADDPTGIARRPVALAAQGAELAMLDRLAQEVVIFSDQLQDRRRYGLAAGTYRGVSDLALATERFFLVNPQTSRLEVWSRDGALLAEPYVPAGPERVAALADGTAFVLASSGWVYAFGPLGEGLAAWRAGEAGSRPSDIGTDSSGRVYVTDQKGEVRVYAPDPDQPAEPPPVGGPGRCTAVRDKHAAPPVVWLGEEVTVRLEVDGACPAEQAPADIALVVDTSGSMAAGAKMAAARDAAINFVLRMDPVLARIGVVSFDDAATVRQGLTGNKANLLDAVEALAYNSAGQTNMVAGLSAARQMLAGSGARPGVAKVLVFLTDGVHKPDISSTDPYPPELAAEILAVHNAGIQVFGVGLGGDADRTVLARVASGPDFLFFSPLPGDLSAVYVQIARRLQADLLFEEATVVDVVPGNMSYVEGSAEPQATWDPAARTLTWDFLDVLPPGFTMAYRLRPQEPGTWPTNVRADLDYKDAYGRAGALVFPVPEVLVLVPETPTPTPTAVTPTATPTLIATLPPSWRVYLPILLQEHCDADRLHITLVLDASSSMTAPFGQGGQTKLDAARTAVRALLDQVDLSRDTVGLVQFHNSARRLAHGADRGALEAALRDLAVEPGTRIDLGLVEGLADARAGRQHPGVRAVLILLSDGAPDPGTATDALVAAQDVRDDGVTFYTVAVGQDADRDFLARAAGDSTRAFRVADGEALVRLYERLGETLVPCVAGWGR